MNRSRRSARPHQLRAQLERLRHTDRLDRHVRAESTGQLADDPLGFLSRGDRRTYSACTPSTRCPRIQPPPPRHWP
ncbi:hypothetical protein ACFOWZ_04745 [Lentzea rhizosphaerae]|uniref:Uncharacterized protein n=1 Tax=Lentzea rhizosphaerae TaxID=2041025 RepID=A0ABV8BKG7_9PSEU